MMLNDDVVIDVEQIYGEVTVIRNDLHRFRVNLTPIKE